MNPARVLIVDDEPQIRRVLKPALIAAGHEVSEAATGREALSMLAGVDLVILDLGLPDMDGKETLRRLRLATKKTPVIVLSARDRETEKIAALDLGADDYVEKPFAIGELLARMRAALRHAREGSEPLVVTSGALWVDFAKRRVTKDGDALHLTPREFDLLAMLARHPDRPVTHGDLLENVWGKSHRDDTQYLRVFIGQLRAKIEDDPAAPRIIVTDTGVGYRFVADEEN
jgi:two-component system, OmpR family, KDP operon response regulator KdpE